MGDHDGKDSIDKALRLFVYGPLGLAGYVRDNAPTLMEVFVQRGKREVDNARRAVEDLLGQRRPAPSPAAGARAASDVGPDPGSDMPRGGDTAPEAPSAATSDLPISGYDLLSAPQVIERLEGLSRGALDRLRSHEISHRARRTILTAIDHLTG